ncbi:MAG: hypothetical protein KF819_24325 [Labilithrix sp.]|nr:hypothetical protein [Labilithrix sp.]
MLFVFVASLGGALNRASEAEALAPRLGLTPYEARLALATPAPSILLATSDRDRATDALALLRSRGHGAHAFDGESFVSSDRMTKLDDFRLDADGVRRSTTGDLLPYGDVFAILRAVHDRSGRVEHQARPGIVDTLMPTGTGFTAESKIHDREHVAYFFRRSGEKPWLLRETHTSYVGLGIERSAVAFVNFTRTLARVREASSMAVFDDRLVRRRVAERADAEGGLRSSRDGIDLLAHLLAMTIASQGGSPYR